MDIKQLLSKVKETQHLFTDIQKQLKDKKVEGDAGAGLVKVTVNGAQEITNVYIDPELILMKDKELLQDLIKAAANQAREKAIEMSQNLLAEQIRQTGLDPSEIKNMFSK